MKRVKFTGMKDEVKRVKKSELPNTCIDVPSFFVKGKTFWDGTTFPVEKSELPNTSIDVPSFFVKGKIFWDGTTFPDATLSRQQKEALEERASKSVEDVWVEMASRLV